MGTANAVSGALGIPGRFETQVKLVLESRTRLLDLGQAGERLFIMCAGVGFDAVVVHDISRIRVGRSISLFSYIAPTLRTLFRYPHGPMRVSIDGKPVEAASYFTVIGNLNRYGGPFRFFTDASPSDGLLDVCCLRGNRAVDFCRYAIGALMRKLSVFQDVYTYRGRRVVVTADRPLPVQTDGDPGGRLPMTFAVLPEAAVFCVP
jgi:diacylglycerol kinase family enzyme